MPASPARQLYPRGLHSERGDSRARGDWQEAEGQGRTAPAHTPRGRTAGPVGAVA